MRVSSVHPQSNDQAEAHQGQENPSVIRRVQVLTSFNKDGWEKYAKNFVESFIEKFPKEVNLVAYYHDWDIPLDMPNDGRIEYRSLNKIKPLMEWREKFREANGTIGNGQYDYRRDAVKFSHKVFALVDCVQKALEATPEGTDPGYLVWLDADILVNKPVPLTDFAKLFHGAAITHLGRTAIPYSETSFVAYDLGDEAAQEFVADFREVYLTGELFGYAELHDGFAFERLLNLHKWHGLQARNLTPLVRDLNAFANSPLAQWMTHFKGPSAKNQGPKPVRIIPKNSVDPKIIIKHIEENSKLFPHWLTWCTPHTKRAVIASAGPSLKNSLEEIRQLQAEGAFIFCVKHSLPTLLAANIIPFACVLLDARPFDGISTHGVERKSLFNNIHPDVWMLTASMVDPELTRHLLPRTGKVVGWHAFTQGVMDHFTKRQEANKTREFLVTGGTCAATRTIGVAHVMGFREMDLYGFDSSVPALTPEMMTEKDEQGRPRYFQASAGPKGKKFITTGELLSLGQDLEQIFQQESDTILRMHGEGLGPELVRLLPPLRTKSIFPEFAA
jgi:hypothetical protein